MYSFIAKITHLKQHCGLYFCMRGIFLFLKKTVGGKIALFLLLRFYSKSGNFNCIPNYGC